MDGAKNSDDNLIKKIAKLLSADDKKVNNSVVEEWKNKVLFTLNNDINTAGVIVLLQELLKSEVGVADKVEIIKFIDFVLGLRLIENANLLNENVDGDIPQEILDLAQARFEAKKAKDYAKADELRNKISEAGFVIEDRADGFNVKKV